MPRNVDRTIEDIDAAMRALRQASRGIPFRVGSFRTTHQKLTMDVAHLLVLLDSARGTFRDR